MSSHPAASTMTFRDVREETGPEIELIYEPRSCHYRIREVPLPFAIIDGEVADRTTGTHRHVDSVYSYGCSGCPFIRCEDETLSDADARSPCLAAHEIAAIVMAGSSPGTFSFRMSSSPVQRALVTSR
jgi:hypothetical protein